MTTKFMSNMSRTFSNSGFSRTYSSAPKPFHFTKLHQANMSPLPAPVTQKAKRSEGRSNCMAICCCCFTGCVSMLITAAIGLGIAALIIWLVLRPIRTPTYDLQSVNISKLHYNTTIPDLRTLEANVRYEIKATNANGKIAIKYETISIDTSYEGTVFNHHSIPGFVHGHKNVTVLPVAFTTVSFPLDPVRARALEAHIAAQNVPLLLRVDVKARLKIGAISTPVFNVHVNCNLAVKPSVGAAPATVISQICKKV